MLRLRDRDHFFTSETLAKFLLDSGGEGTGPESCGRLRLSAVEERKPQERVALWRETFESSLGSSKLSPFFFLSKMVRCEGHTDHKGECVCGSLL